MLSRLYDLCYRTMLSAAQRTGVVGEVHPTLYAVIWYPPDALPIPEPMVYWDELRAIEHATRVRRMCPHWGLAVVPYHAAERVVARWEPSERPEKDYGEDDE